MSTDAHPLWASRCEAGARRTNEDAVVCAGLPDGRWLAAVADGMGGVGGGEVASRTALDVLAERLAGGASLLRAVGDANRAVFRNRGGRSVGTTLVAALFTGRRLLIANVGDSRAYLLGPPGLVQVTRDHTYATEALQHGRDTAREVATSRWGATLTRAVGLAENVEVDEFGPLALDNGVQVLLCSDGLHRALSDREIEDCLTGGGSLDDAVDRLVARSLERGSLDNVSAVVLQHAGGAGPGRATGTVLRGDGVPQSAGGEGPRASEPPLPDEPEPEAGETPVVLPPGDARERPPGSARWDPARMAARSPRSWKRKPGRLQGVLVILGLLVVALVLLALLP